MYKTVYILAKQLVMDSPREERREEDCEETVGAHTLQDDEKVYEVKIMGSHKMAADTIKAPLLAKEAVTGGTLSPTSIGKCTSHETMGTELASVPRDIKPTGGPMPSVSSAIAPSGTSAIRKTRATAAAAFEAQLRRVSNISYRLNMPELLRELALADKNAETARTALEQYHLQLMDAENYDGPDSGMEEAIQEADRFCIATGGKVRDQIRQQLWENFARPEVIPAVLRAGTACAEAANAHAKLASREECDKQYNWLRGTISEAQRALSAQRDIIPGDVWREVNTELHKAITAADDLYRRWVSECIRAEEMKAHMDAEIKETQQKEALARLLAAQEQREAQRRVMEQRPFMGDSARGAAAAANPLVRLQQIKLPMFSGDCRSYCRWLKDWSSLQRQGDPSGSPEVKKLLLLDSVDPKTVEELRLASYGTAESVLEALGARFGDKAATALQIMKDLEKSPPVTGSQPRQVIKLIQDIEKAVIDLSELGSEETIKNPLAIQTIEGKLPRRERWDWVAIRADPTSGINPSNHFEKLMGFLKARKVVLCAMEKFDPTDSARTLARPDRRAFTKSSAREDNISSDEEDQPCHTNLTETKPGSTGCEVCGDMQHRGKLFRCQVFRRSNLKDKQRHLQKSGRCQRCLESHRTGQECATEFLCKSCGPKPDHHSLLCPIPRKKRDGGKEMEELKKLIGELEEKVRGLPSPAPAAVDQQSTTFKANRRSKSPGSVREYPVLMMLQNVEVNHGRMLGALIDLASDTNYITHEAASQLGLEPEKVQLVVFGVGGMKTAVSTSRYTLKVKVMTPRKGRKFQEIVCYGLEEIARVDRPISSCTLKKFFPSADEKELVRPSRVDLLISHREGRLAPTLMERVGDLVLWDGPLGKTVGGSHPALFEKTEVIAHDSRTHFARSMRTCAIENRSSPTLDPASKEPSGRGSIDPKSGRTNMSNREVQEWWRWDSIGAACDPKCGGCRCGKCQPGGKELTLEEERSVSKILAGLTYKRGDSHCSTPHWDAKYPWTEDPATLPPNRRAAEGTFRKTEERLQKDPKWGKAYAEQVHEMLQRGAACKLSSEEIAEWKGPVWYVSHLIAPNPHSVTTPIRLVWNSSQEHRGASLNSILLKGPDVLNPIRGVLLRFRVGQHAALGDVSKMYNSVWLEEVEKHLHRFVWRDSPADEIQDFAIQRVNIGDRPAGCIAQLAMRETARLPEFVEYAEGRRVIEEDTYVDDILTSHDCAEQLKKITKQVETILQAGGFALKPWTFSGQSGRRSQEAQKGEREVLILPNQMGAEEDKALGVGYLAESDHLFLRTAINFSKRKLKVRTGTNLTEEEVGIETPNPLTRRHLLSQIAGVYDPIGLATPLKEKGAILLRRACQQSMRTSPDGDAWDFPLPEETRSCAIELFKEYVRVNEVNFKRALTPEGKTGKPWGVTFSDGSDNAYGAVLYLRWKTESGIQVRLVESKAKLAPLEQKGDVVKAEVCGAVFAARLRRFWERNSRLEVERWIHLVDSTTILGAIQRESYGYQTFFANRIGEIQGATSPHEWKWVPGDLNVADLLTRGCAPEALSEGTAWQEGPAFLKEPENEWPVRTAAEVVAEARDAIGKLQRKAFTAVQTRAQKRKGAQAWEPDPPLPEPDRGAERPCSAAAAALVQPQRYSNLTKLCRVTARVLQAAERFKMGRSKAGSKAKWEEKRRQGLGQPPALSPQDLHEAFISLCLDAQQGVVFPRSTLDRLVVSRNPMTGVQMCHGRARKLGSSGIPLLPRDSWLSMLVAREAHQANHEGPASTVLRMRKRAWVVRGPRVAWKVCKDCIHCRKTRAKACVQQMGELPEERTTPAAPFEYTAVDMCGPYEVKDVVKRRASMKVWGIVFSCMVSRAVYADVVESPSVDNFLKVFSRFTAVRGCPKKLWSDRGTNFVGAEPAIRGKPTLFSDDACSDLQDRTAGAGVEWNFCSADAPHRNGVAEAGVKIFKGALSSVGVKGNLSCLELQTLFFLAANLANERPIGARVQVKDDEVAVVTPNSLLLGRARPSGDPEVLDAEAYSLVRLRAIQTEVAEFWRRWSQLAGPNLHVRQKWHTRVRDVQVGDIVWVADQNALRGRYRLGRVVAVVCGRDGAVRDADVKVYGCRSAGVCHPAAGLETDGSSITAVVRRDVRRLVVLLAADEQ